MTESQLKSRIQSLLASATDSSIPAWGIVETNLKTEVDSALVGNVRKSPSGALITDFIRLAKVVLNEDGKDAINVAAVLTAVAYEDTIRRMGETFAGIIEKDDLRDVIHALQTMGVLVLPQLSMALSYLSFRDHALDANWDEIDRSAVSSCLGFVEELLFTHFQ